MKKTILHFLFFFSGKKEYIRVLSWKEKLDYSAHNLHIEGNLKCLKFHFKVDRFFEFESFKINLQCPKSKVKLNYVWKQGFVILQSDCKHYDIKNLDKSHSTRSEFRVFF